MDTPKRALLKMCKDMSLSLSAFCKVVTCCSLALVSSLDGLAASSFAPNGGEYPISGTLPTDQVRPSLALQPGGGFLAWEDTITDGDGLGISARRVGAGLAGTLSPFRVNAGAVGDQERARVTLLKNGGAAFVWQGGKMGSQHIFARFLSPDGTWATGDVAVSEFNSSFQTYADIATLANGNVVVVWSSYNQRAADSMQDVYARILTPNGDTLTPEIPVNQFSAKANQRTPVVAALPDGGFVVAWVSEMQRSQVDNPDPNWQYTPGAGPSVDIYARRFTSSGASSGGEFLVNTSNNACANPAVAVGAEGLLFAWSEADAQNPANLWDIHSRRYSLAWAPSAVQKVNNFLLGNQVGPQVSPAGDGFLVVWTSVGQDGSREGVYGRFLDTAGSASGSEFIANTTRVSKQQHPAVAADGEGQALVVWTGFIGGASSFDLFGQRYVDSGKPLLPMAAPFLYVPFTLVNGAYQPQVQVSWPEQEGLSVERYEVYLNGASSPVASVTGNVWLMTPEHGLKANSSLSIQVAFVTTDGRRSPLSSAASARTWGGYNWGGVPFEWMTDVYGSDLSTWPAAGTQLAAGGPTLLQAFISGSDPRTPSTWLKTQLVPTTQGIFLTWNPRPGLIYQVQRSQDLVNWQNVGAQRLAVGTQDSLHVGDGQSGYYRVVLQR